MPILIAKDIQYLNVLHVYFSIQRHEWDICMGLLQIIASQHDARHISAE